MKKKDDAIMMTIIQIQWIIFTGGRIFLEGGGRYFFEDEYFLRIGSYGQDAVGVPNDQEHASKTPEECCAMDDWFGQCYHIIIIYITLAPM